MRKLRGPFVKLNIINLLRYIVVNCIESLWEISINKVKVVVIGVGCITKRLLLILPVLIHIVKHCQEKYNIQDIHFALHLWIYRYMAYRNKTKENTVTTLAVILFTSLLAILKMTLYNQKSLWDGRVKICGRTKVHNGFFEQLITVRERSSHLYSFACYTAVFSEVWCSSIKFHKRNK